MRVHTVVRYGLIFLTITQLGVGFWALLFPRSFFDIPWVGMRMSYNEHLMLDYGAMSLAMAVVLGAAAVVIRLYLVRVALVCYLVFAVPHLVIHVRLLHHLSPAEGTVLLIGLGMAIAIPGTLLALTSRW